jgi:hypothetical protein
MDARMGARSCAKAALAVSIRTTSQDTLLIDSSSRNRLNNANR